MSKIITLNVNLTEYGLCHECAFELASVIKGVLEAVGSNHTAGVVFGIAASNNIFEVAFAAQNITQRDKLCRATSEIALQTVSQ